MALINCPTMSYLLRVLDRKEYTFSNEKIFILVVCTLLAVTGCSEKIQNNLYDTDTFGMYEAMFYTTDNADPIAHYQLTLYSDNTFTYSLNENYKDSFSDEYKGDVLSIEDINKDITRIILDNENNKYMGQIIALDSQTIYKYKNLLGNYIPSVIEKKKTFFIPYNNQDSHGNTFYKDGTMWSDGTSAKYNYKIESNIIWVEFDADFGYQPYYYVVDGGVFSGILTKQN